MSPIALAYIGVTAVVISFELLLMNIFSKKFVRSIFLFMIIMGGMTIIVFSATRSALLATFFICTIITIFHFESRGEMQKKIWIFFAVVTFVILSYVILEKMGSDAVSRLELMMRQLAVGDPDAGGGSVLL